MNQKKVIGQVSLGRRSRTKVNQYRTADMTKKDKTMTSMTPRLVLRLTRLLWKREIITMAACRTHTDAATWFSD